MLYKDKEECNKVEEPFQMDPLTFEHTPINEKVKAVHTLELEEAPPVYQKELPAMAEGKSELAIEGETNKAGENEESGEETKEKREFKFPRQDHCWVYLIQKV